MLTGNPSRFAGLQEDFENFCGTLQACQKMSAWLLATGQFWGTLRKDFQLQRDASQEEEVSYTDEEEEEDKSEDRDEQDIRSRLLDVSVTEEPPPGFPPLTRHQLRQHQDALDVSLCTSHCQCDAWHQ